MMLDTASVPPWSRSWRRTRMLPESLVLLPLLAAALLSKVEPPPRLRLRPWPRQLWTPLASGPRWPLGATMGDILLAAPNLGIEFTFSASELGPTNYFCQILFTMELAIPLAARCRTSVLLAPAAIGW